MDGHGETSIPPYNFVVGGIMKPALETTQGMGEKWSFNIGVLLVV
jgi:hypothetical protein